MPALRSGRGTRPVRGTAKEQLDREVEPQGKVMSSSHILTSSPFRSQDPGGGWRWGGVPETVISLSDFLCVTH